MQIFEIKDIIRIFILRNNFLKNMQSFFKSLKTPANCERFYLLKKPNYPILLILANTSADFILTHIHLTIEHMVETVSALSSNHFGQYHLEEQY